MGYNLVSCCHVCQVQMGHFRGEESDSIFPFYMDHLNCIKFSGGAVETCIDQTNEPDWMATYREVKPAPVLCALCGATKPKEDCVHHNNGYCRKFNDQAAHDKVEFKMHEPGYKNG